MTFQIWLPLFAGMERWCGWTCQSRKHRHLAATSFFTEIKKTLQGRAFSRNVKLCNDQKIKLRHKEMSLKNFSRQNLKVFHFYSSFWQRELNTSKQGKLWRKKLTGAMTRQFAFFVGVRVSPIGPKIFKTTTTWPPRKEFKAQRVRGTPRVQGSGVLRACYEHSGCTSIF